MQTAKTSHSLSIHDWMKESAQCMALNAIASIGVVGFWAILSNIHNRLEEKHGIFGYIAYDEKTMFQLAGYIPPLLIGGETFALHCRRLQNEFWAVVFDPWVATQLVIAVYSGCKLKKLVSRLLPQASKTAHITTQCANGTTVDGKPIYIQFVR